jgi:hypothetical protein
LRILGYLQLWQLAYDVVYFALFPNPETRAIFYFKYSFDSPTLLMHRFPDRAGNEALS